MLHFTHSQQSAISAFKIFLDGSERVFILKGAAGTGKTTIVKEFLKILQERKREFALMAPTGRAAHIIGQKTGQSSTTIHRGIYSMSSITDLKKSVIDEKNPEDDNSRMNFRFELKRNDDPASKVYIIDESSMISDAYSENEAFSFGSGRLLSDLFEYANGRKVIFVGDHAQLPPVGMDFSPAIDTDYLSTHFDCRVS